MASGFSEYGYYVRKPSATPLLYANNAPASAGASRDLANNLELLADQAGQVWACDGLRSGAYLTTESTPPSTPGHLARVVCHAIRTRPTSTSHVGGSTADGGAYALRVQVGAARGTAGTATFYVIAGPMDDPLGGYAAVRAAALAGGATAGTNETSGTTASATEAWITLGTNILRVTSGVLAACRRTIASYAYDAAGTAIASSVDVFSIAVDVYGYAPVGQPTQPRLHGLYVAEYVG